MTLTDNTTRIADDSRTIDHADSPAGDDREATRGEAGSVPVGSIVLFLLGCGVLVAAAMTVSNLGSWGARQCLVHAKSLLEFLESEVNG
ncbi:hypothetical protein [Gordonia spumicola]|uniref:hypothetical protein n=1 Tax=Gordonia spumicola TaxID=589161 RepID=UPI001379C9BA|nr:hypothetical protein [Gordonia spumicola]